MSTPYLVDDPRRQRLQINGRTHQLVFKRNGVIDLHIDGQRQPFNIDATTTLHLGDTQRTHRLLFTPAPVLRTHQPPPALPATVLRTHQPPPALPVTHQLSYMTDLITKLVRNGLLPCQDPHRVIPPCWDQDIDYWATSTFSLDVIPLLRMTNAIEHHMKLLYGGGQCPRCGLRLAPDAYQRHLQDHFLEHQQQPSYRRWYPSLTLWLHQKMELL